jgi:hypothetical protein
MNRCGGAQRLSQVQEGRMTFAFGLIILLLAAVYWHERWRERKVERDRQEKEGPSDLDQIRRALIAKKHDLDQRRRCGDE